MLAKSPPPEHSLREVFELRVQDALRRAVARLRELIVVSAENASDVEAACNVLTEHLEAYAFCGLGPTVDQKQTLRRMAQLVKFKRCARDFAKLSVGYDGCFGRPFWSEYFTHFALLLPYKGKVQGLVSSAKKCIADNRRTFIYGLKRDGSLHSYAPDLVRGRASSCNRDPARFLSLPMAKVCNTVPEAYWKRLAAVEKAILKVVDTDDPRGNSGVSLGLTVVDGGTHARQGASGSIHLNRNVWTEKATPESVKLQLEIIDAVADIICNAFEDTFWFKKCMKLVEDVPDENLLPGRRLPCSHICFTSDPKEKAIHIDRNSVLVAFCFCATRVEGGELIVYSETGVKCIHLGDQNLIAGIWHQFAHYNLAVSSGDRHSFVVYLDGRVVDDTRVRVLREGEKELFYT